MFTEAIRRWDTFSGQIANPLKRLTPCAANPTLRWKRGPGKVLKKTIPVVDGATLASKSPAAWWRHTPDLLLCLFLSFRPARLHRL